MACEDAPCCGCCGTNLYGVRQDDLEQPDYCDACGYDHFGPCDDGLDYLDDDEDWDGDDDWGGNEDAYIDAMAD